MVERSRSHHLRFRADFVGHFRRQVGHLHGVIESALRHFRHAAQQAVVDVGQFHQRHARSEAEHPFYEIHQRVGEQQENAADDHVHRARLVESLAAEPLREVIGKTYQQAGTHHGQHRAEQLRAFRQLAQGINGRQSRYQLEQHKFKRVVERDGREQGHHDVGNERRARIHEYAHENGNDGIRHKVDTVEVVRHHQVGYHGKRRQQREEQ